MTTIAITSDNDLVYTVNGSSASFGWGLTEDGKGIVIWDDNGFQILPANVQLEFSDKTVDTSSLFDDTGGDPGGDPSDDALVHKLTGNSSDWGWDVTEDGEGIVVWSDTGFEILPANVQLQFSDRTVNTSSLFGDPSGDGSVHKLSGSSSDWGWDVTEDGEGVVVWDDNGFHILPAKVRLQFSDKTVDTSSLFEDPEPELASVGGTVWFDENQNRLQDNGEGGLSEFKVLLVDADFKVIDETVPDADGKYVFEDLAAGDYRISFRETGAYYFTEKSVGNAADTVGSDINVAASVSDVFTLGPDKNSKTINAGFLLVNDPEPDPGAVLGSIGGMVWRDENQNGLQDNGEGGISNVRIQLRNADGHLLHETISGWDGRYLFEDRAMADYKVYFGDTGSFEFTEKDVADNSADTADSDVNADTALTDVFTLGAGEHNQTVSAGLYLDSNDVPSRVPEVAGFTDPPSNQDGDYIL